MIRKVCCAIAAPSRGAIVCVELGLEQLGLERLPLGTALREALAGFVGAALAGFAIGDAFELCLQEDGLGAVDRRARSLCGVARLEQDAQRFLAGADEEQEAGVIGE